MISIKTAFGRAASGKPRVSTFWLLAFAIAILDDAQDREKRREEERRKKRERDKPKPPAGPR
jgi:hypothetical protein